MTLVKARQHQWVSFRVTPISVLPDEDGDPVVFIDPEKAAAAEEVIQHGCLACLAPLVGEELEKECPGESVD